MKSAIIAAAAVVAVASAHEARSPLGLGLDVGVGDLINIHAKICLNLEVNLPLGISIESKDDCPRDGPPEGCTDVWHPPHHVPMDGCDDNGNHEWHYVHPCDCKPTAPHTWTTSTVTQTQVQTIISCAPTVTNCPAGGSTVTTVTVPATTFICPVPVTTTTLATVPATVPTYTVPATTQAPPTWTQPATVPTYTVPATTQAPPTWTKPATTPVVVVPPPASTPCPESTTPVVVVPPPMGTGSQPPAGNWTQPPVIAGAAQTSQKLGAVVAMGLVAALLI